MAIMIPRVTGRQVTDSAGPVAQVSPAQVDTPNLGTALTTAGINVQAVENARNAEMEQAEISRAGLAVATARAKWAEESRKREEAAPLGAPDYSAGLLKDYDEDTAPLIQGMQSPRAKLYTQQALTELRGSLATNAARFETEARTKKIAGEQSAAIDESRKYLRNHIDEFDAIAKDHDNYLTASGLPENVREPLRVAGRGLLADSAVTGFVERDPARALAELKADQSSIGAINALTPEARERQINAAETEIRRREAEARARAAEARAAATERATFLRDYMADAQESYAMGFGLPKDYGEARAAILSLPDDNPNKQRLLRQDAVLSSLDSAGFLALNPDEQDAQLTALEAQMQANDASPVGVDMLKIGRSVQAETERRAKADPFAFAVQRGIVELPAATGDARADLAARAEAARKASAYLGRPVPGFTTTELETIAEKYSKGSLDDRAALLFSLTDTHGQRQAATVFEALDKQGHSSMALAGALTLEAPDAARLVIRGQRALDEGGKANLVPKDADVRGDLSDLLGNAYGIGTKSRATVESGIMAAYAALSAEAGDQSGDLDSARLQAAVNAVTGGIVEYGGMRFPAPKRGVTQDRFEQWADALTADDFSGVAGLDPGYAFDAWRREGWLEAVGPNQFVPVIEGPSGPVFLQNAAGKPVTLSYDGRTNRKPLGEAFLEGYGATR